jgi:hypothetical protein
MHEREIKKIEEGESFNSYIYIYIYIYIYRFGE